MMSFTKFLPHSTPTGLTEIIVLVDMKVKVTQEKVTKAQRESGSEALLFFNWALDVGGLSTPNTGRFTPGKNAVPIL
jgi:hypothetical protein